MMIVHDSPGEQAHVFGASTHNHRVQNSWSHLKKTCTSWWIYFCKDLVEELQLNLDHEYTSKCLWFCFNDVLQSSLDEAKLNWKTHYILPSCHLAMKLWLEYQTSYLIFQSNLGGSTFVSKFLHISCRKYKLNTHRKTMRMTFNTILGT